MTCLFARCPSCRQRQLMTCFDPPCCLACAPIETVAPVIETLLDAMVRNQHLHAREIAGQRRRRQEAAS